MNVTQKIVRVTFTCQSIDAGPGPGTLLPGFSPVGVRHGREPTPVAIAGDPIPPQGMLNVESLHLKERSASREDRHRHDRERQFECGRERLTHHVNPDRDRQHDRLDRLLGRRQRPLLPRKTFIANEILFDLVGSLHIIASSSTTTQDWEAPVRVRARGTSTRQLIGCATSCRCSRPEPRSMCWAGPQGIHRTETRGASSHERASTRFGGHEPGWLTGGCGGFDERVGEDNRTTVPSRR